MSLCASNIIIFEFFINYVSPESFSLFVCHHFLKVCFKLFIRGFLWRWLRSFRLLFF